MSPRTRALIAACAVLGGLTLIDPAPPPAPSLPRLRLPAIADLDRIEVQHPDGRQIVLARDGARDWSIVEPLRAAIDPTALAGLKTAFATPPAAGIGETVPGAELPAYGLAPPGLRVRLLKGDRPLAALRLGKVIGGDRTFVANLLDLEPAAALVYRAQGNLRRVFDRQLRSWRLRRLFPYQREQVARVEVRRRGKLRLRALRTAGAPWRLEPGFEGADLDLVEIDGLGHTIATLEASEFLPELPATFKPELTVEARTFAGERFGVEIGRRSPHGGAPARRLGDPAAFVLPGHLIRLLDRPRDAYRQRRLFDFGDRQVQRLELTYPASGPITLARGEGGAWYMKTPHEAGPLLPDRVVPFVEMICGATTVGFPTEAPPGAFDTPWQIIDLQLEASPPSLERRVRLIVGAVDRNGLRWARVEGRPGVYRVSRLFGKRLRPKPTAFFQPTVDQRDRWR